MAKKSVSGADLFNKRDWFRINRLMIFNLSDEESVMFSFLAHVEQDWEHNFKKQSFSRDKLDGHCLITTRYVLLMLNKDKNKQKRALDKLSERGLIDVKYWAKRRRMFKINWTVFDKLYVSWVNKYEDMKKEISEEESDYKNLALEETKNEEFFKNIVNEDVPRYSNH